MLCTDASATARWLRRVLGAVMGAALGLALGVSIAEAADDNSAVKFFQTNTVQYSNVSYLRNGSDAVYRTQLTRMDHGDATPGKMGARARAYFSNGLLCETTATRYNEQATDFLSVQAPQDDCGGYVYSQGFTDTWDGNGYERVSTFRTVNLLF